MQPKFVGFVLELRPLYGRPNYVLAVGATTFSALKSITETALFPKFNEKPGIPLPPAPALVPNFTEMLIQLVDLEPRLLLLTCMRKTSFPGIGRDFGGSGSAQRRHQHGKSGGYRDRSVSGDLAFVK